LTGFVAYSHFHFHQRRVIMKIFVLGALLLQTLNAQTDGTVTTDAVAVDDGTATSTASLAPLITPGTDAPTEADLLGSSTDSAASSTVEIDTLDLPAGTADVILDAPVTPTSTNDASSAEEIAGTVDDTSGFTFPTPINAPADVTPTPIPEDGAVGTATVQALGADVAPTPTAADDFLIPDFDPTPAASPDAFSMAVEPDTTDDATAVAPEATDLPGDGSGLGEDPTLPEESPSSSSSDIAFLGPDVTPASAASEPTGLGAAENADEDSPYDESSGPDTTHYDGQDYSDDDECPSYCMEDGGEYDEGDSDDTPSTPSRKLRRRRQNMPSSNGGFAAFQWGGDGTGTEDCADDVPDWLYETTGRQPVACKPKCPASCYASKPTGYAAQPTPTGDGHSPHTTDDATTAGGYSTYGTDTSTTDDATTTDDYSPYVTNTFTTDDATTTDDYSTYSTDTSTTDYPDSTTTEPYEAYVTPDMPTADYTDSTTTSTATTSTATTSTPTTSTPTTSTPTTFVTSTMTEEPAQASTGGSAPDADNTGDTLDSVCPKQCNPFDPAQNKCDITTSCTTTGNNKYFCACRAGFRSSEWNEKDFSKQFKFDGQPYVYTAEGVVCDELCNDQTCSEVIARPQCQ
jgi:hypothetical protein